MGKGLHVPGSKLFLLSRNIGKGSAISPGLLLFQVGRKGHFLYFFFLVICWKSGLEMILIVRVMRAMEGIPIIPRFPPLLPVPEVQMWPRLDAPPGGKKDIFGRFFFPRKMSDKRLRDVFLLLLSG